MTNPVIINTMPPSFSRFRSHEAVAKRPRTTFNRKSLQPKVFVPPNSSCGLPQPINIPPDIFSFPVSDDLPGINFPNDPVAVARVVGVPEHDIVQHVETSQPVRRSSAVAASEFVADPVHSVPTFSTLQLPSKPENVTQIIPQQVHHHSAQQQQLIQQTHTTPQQVRTPPPPPVRRRASGFLPQASRAPWLLYEDRLLTILTRRYPGEWELISAHFSDRSAIQLQKRWHEHLKLSRKWSREETALIQKLQLQHPNDWTIISTSLRSRTPASIRYHWFYNVCHEPEYS